MSIVGGALVGARVLDLYAGSGALGLEALSRGAGSLTAVETDARALNTLRANVAALGVEEKVTVHRRGVLRFLREVPEPAFDVAFADPPYGSGEAPAVAALFRERPFAAILGLEHPSSQVIDGDETRRYGETTLTFWYVP